MGSMILTEEEMRYFRALLSWDPSMVDDNTFKKPRGADAPLAGEFRFLILESGNHGKTSILHKFFNDSSSSKQSYSPRLGETRGCQSRIQIDEKTYKFDVLELEFAQLADPKQFNNAVAITEAAAIVYDIRNRDSFALARELHAQVQQALSMEKRRPYTLILVGNKSDDGDRHVSWAEGYKLAHTLSKGGEIIGEKAEERNARPCAFIETSARDVDQLFVTLGREVLQMRRAAQQRREQQLQAEEFARSTALIGDPNRTSSKRKWRVWSRAWFWRSSDQGSRSDTAMA
ncbi:P-loop containing nucleoside triphosphate hydrolase protein [Xylariaceae sp. FL0255]|nr:P-loop containing nucleoside triphosphate hydrolase protein [Xylariaceae sp. FL0255]